MVGTGSSVFDLNVTAFNPAFFISSPGASLEFTTTNSAPFKLIDPSMLFPGLGPGGTNVVPNLGAINGASGPDFALVTDAFVSAPTAPAPVPEPSTLVMAGIGVGLDVLLGRQRQRHRWLRG